MVKKTTQQAGFTLVEISLAMAIFTFMLLVVSLAYINIARLYNASTAARNVQQNNRFAMEQISRVARVNSVVTPANFKGKVTKVCFGSTRFELRNLDTRDLYKNELVQSDDCGAATPLNPKILSAAGSYAAQMEIDSTTEHTVTISLWMVSKTDLLDNTNPDLTCKGGTGSEFCAINKLTTTVELRGDN